MCEFCPTSGPCSMPWCDNHWSAWMTLAVPAPSAPLLAEKRLQALRRGQRRESPTRQQFARWVYVGALAGFVGLAALAWAGVG